MPEHIIEIENNTISALLYGANSENLRVIEHAFQVSVAEKGNKLRISGEENAINNALQAINKLTQVLENGAGYLTHEDMYSTIQMIHNQYEPSESDITINVRKNIIKPRTQNQQLYVKYMQNNTLSFGIGPAGTGKTFLAVCYGVSLLMSGRVDKIIITRPVVEAGESLGFLPGDMNEKVDPFLRPINDALSILLPKEEIERMKMAGHIEIAPLAYMRGRTLKNAFILLDEAQNATAQQLKMFFTRLGENSFMTVTGDPSQIDLPHKTPSGLLDALQRLKNIHNIAILYFNAGDITRHPLVSAIVKAYEK